MWRPIEGKAGIAEDSSFGLGWRKSCEGRGDKLSFRATEGQRCQKVIRVKLTMKTRLETENQRQMGITRINYSWSHRCGWNDYGRESVERTGISWGLSQWGLFCKPTLLETPRRVTMWFPLLIELCVRFVGKNYKTELPSELWKAKQSNFFYLKYWHIPMISTVLGCDSLGVNMIWT